MPAFDAAAYRPPASVAQVVVRSPTTGAIVADVPMLIDTGADVSLLPREAIFSLLDADSPKLQVELQGFDGVTTIGQATVLEAQFLGKAFFEDSTFSLRAPTAF